MPRIRADLVIVAAEAALLVAAVVEGAVLNRRGVLLHADAAPVFAVWQPHRGWGTPAAIAVAIVVVWFGPGWAKRASWPRLLAGGYLGAIAWTLALALVDGWSEGLATRLTPQGEYLWDVHRVTDIPAMMATFTSGILDFTQVSWATHVAGHPPGAFLIFVLLDRVGLGGGGPAALVCVLAGASVAVSVPVTLRALGDEPAARAVLPFLVLFPGAVWLGASADALFAAVVAAGLALVALPVRARWGTGLLGGVLLGFSLYLSYGLVLAGGLALTVIALRQRDRLATLAAAAVGVAGVVAVFTAAGFWWLDGYRLVIQRYHQGWAADRPYDYWVWANLAALLLCAGPAIGPALYRAFRAVRDLEVRQIGRTGLTGIARPVTTWLPLAAALAIVVADLSGLSKAEVERIWLPFTGWLLVAAARLPGAFRREWLAAQAGTALAINHLLLTNW